MLRTSIILLASVVGLFFTWRHFKRNLALIKVRNQSEPIAWKRAMNYPMTVAWYGYLAALCVGLTINNIL